MEISPSSLILFRFLFNRAESGGHHLNRSCRLSALPLAERAVSQRVGGACALLSDLCEVGVRVGRCFSEEKVRRKERKKKRGKIREEKGEERNFQLFYFGDFLLLKKMPVQLLGRQTDRETDRLTWQ